MSLRHKDDWFQMLFGFEEEFDGGRGLKNNYESVRDRFSLQPPVQNPVTEIPIDFDKEGSVLTSRENNQSYLTGHFFTPSLAQLRERGMEALKKNGQNGEVKCEEIGIGDVLELHQKNPGAMFQVASQFNCLEFASPRAIPENGVTFYCMDHTQGPACSLAAGAATVVRNYYVKVPGDKEYGEGQRADCQLNNLCDLDKAFGNNQTNDNNGHYWRVVNGYTWSSEEQLKHFKERMTALCPTAADYNRMLGHVRIGLHAGVETTFAKRWERPSRGAVVSQAFCSAISCAYSGVNNKYWEPMAQLIMDAAYEATLWAAVVDKAAGRGSGVVFLTKLGGGVFGNSDRWIAKSIVRACKVLQSHGAALDVRVCHFRVVDHKFTELLKESFSALNQ